MTSAGTLVSRLETKLPEDFSLVSVADTKLPGQITKVPGEFTKLPRQNTKVPFADTKVPDENTKVPCAGRLVPFENTKVPSEKKLVSGGLTLGIWPKSRVFGPNPAVIGQYQPVPAGFALVFGLLTKQPSVSRLSEPIMKFATGPIVPILIPHE